MAPASLHFTRADYDRLPEDFRVELIDGELVKMASPTIDHQQIVKRLLLAMVDQIGVDRVVVGPLDFAVDNRNALVPDLVALADPPPEGARGISTAAIVAEVLSPSTARRDKTVKTDLYLRQGVQEVWLLDPKRRTVEIRRAAGEEKIASAGTARSRAVPGFEIKIAELFG